MNLKFETFHHQTGGILSEGSPFRKDAFKGMVRSRMATIFNAWNANRGGKLLPS